MLPLTLPKGARVIKELGLFRGDQVDADTCGDSHAHVAHGEATQLWEISSLLDHHGLGRRYLNRRHISLLYKLWLLLNHFTGLRVELLGNF